MKGMDNRLADMLSGSLLQITCSFDINFDMLKLEQTKDKALQHLLIMLPDNFEQLLVNETNILCQKGERPVIYWPRQYN